MVAWRVARSLDSLLAQFNTACPKRSKASDGSIGDAAHASRTSDHNPWVDIPGESLNAVTARDYTHDPVDGMDIDRITDELVASRDPRIKYIIANGQIVNGAGGSSPWSWKHYGGSNAHRAHFHLSVRSEPRYFDDPSPWRLPMFVNQPIPGTVDPPVMPGDRRLLFLTKPPMVGDDVKAVQLRLNRDYPKYSHLEVDRTFGRVTDQVVREFQRRSGLSVDGKVGPATLKALKLL